MATEKKQLSTWMTEQEAEALATYARRENRTVSQTIRLTMLAVLVQEGLLAVEVTA